MGRAPCCDKNNVKKGPWSPEEDAKLKSYIEEKGTGGNWIALPQKIGLKRCGKSCRLRWLNYLRPNIKHGAFSEEEDKLICSLYISIGSRWSIIAAQLPGRTDNDIKNYWNTKLKKKLLGKHKNQGANGGSASQALSSSAIERMQLHMHLQGRDSPFTFYSNPLLWPKPFQGQQSQPLPTAVNTAIATNSDLSNAEEADANSMSGFTQSLENMNESANTASLVPQEDMNLLLLQEVNGVDSYAENITWWDNSGMEDNYMMGFGV